MNKSGAPSPSRSQGAPVTPRRNNPRRSRSLGSPAHNISSRPATAVDHFKEYNRISLRLSPLSKTILTDNTDIEEPRRNSWWKKIDNSRDISCTVGVLEDGRNTDRTMETNVLNEEFDIEVLSQERRDYTFDLPDSSGSESIGSIVIPQRKLLNCNDYQNQPKNSKPTDRLQQFQESINLPDSSGCESIGSIIIPQRKLLNCNDKDQPKNPKPKDMLHQFTSKRESPGRHNKTDVHDKSVNVGAKKLFSQEPQRTKPAFPAALLMISPDKTVANKTKELPTELKSQARHLFGNRPAAKRKNMFADFIVSESEDEISDVQPKLFAFNKVPEPVDRRGSTSRGLRDLSPSSSNTTDLEMEDWNLLPSSTMVDHQLEAMVAFTPGKKVRLSNRLSKVSEAKESEAGTKNNVTDSKTEQSNKSSTSKDKSNSSPVHIAKEQTADKSPEKEQTDTNAENQNTTLNKSKDNSSQMKNASQKIFDIEIITKSMNREMINVDNQIVVENEVANRQDTGSNNIDNAQGNIRTEVKTQQVDNHHNKVNEVTSEAAEEHIQNNDEEDFVLIYDENEQPCNADQENLQKSNENNVEEENNMKGDEMHVVVEDLENVVKTDEIEETPEKEKSQHAVNKVVEESDEAIENAQEVEEKLDNDKHDNFFEENEISAQKLNISDKCINEEMGDNDQEKEMADDQNNEIEAMDNQEEAIESDEEMETNQQEQEIENMEDDEIENNDEELVEEEEIEDEEVQSDSEEEDDNNEVESENEEEDTGEIQNNEIESENEEEEIEEEVNESQEVQYEEDTPETDQEIPNESEEDVPDEDEEQIEEHEEIEEIRIAEDVEDGYEIDHVSESEEQDEEIEEPQQTAEPKDETPNESHDTTGRNRKDMKSPEAILNDVTNHNESFIAKGRNTSFGKTALLKNFSIRPSMAPPRDSTGYSDGTKNSSAEGSGWDSHRTTRKTLRQTFGRDFTPRKSLRALVMEKSAKRQTAINEANAKLNLPQSNSKELPGNAPQDQEMEMDYDENEENVQESDHDMSRRTRQTTLEMYLEKVKKETMEYKLKIDEHVKNSLKLQAPRTDFLNRTHCQPANGRINTKSHQTALKAKKTKRTIIPLENLPQELLEDLKYKPPKRFKGRNASWISKRLYKFLESKLEPKYYYKARVRSEKLVELLYDFTRDIRKLAIAPAHAVSELKHEMARLQIVRTHFEFYEFVRDYLPLEIKVKIVPDIVNDIPLPRNGVFADILTGEVV